MSEEEFVQQNKFLKKIETGGQFEAGTIVPATISHLVSGCEEVAEAASDSITVLVNQKRGGEISHVTEPSYGILPDISRDLVPAEWT
eukprot:767944-Hanusia_phi.AAC.3